METHAFSNPVAVKVVKRRENGSGIIEIPLLPVSEIDLSRTASGGDKTVSITVDVLNEIVANFERFPGPVPIGAGGHDPGGVGGGVSLGFVNAVSVRGNVLYGEVDLTPALFAEVESGGWGGFSVELAKNLKRATAELTGWALTGGVFTNRPATDVNFRIAASDEGTSDEKAIHSICLTAGEEKEQAMEAEKIAALEAELAAEKETVKALRAAAEADKGDSAGLETRLTEANKDLATANIKLSEERAKRSAAESEVARLGKELAKQEQARKEAEIKLEAAENRTLRENVLKLAHKAIDRGVSAKHFEGLEEDPVAWFAKRYVSLEAMEQFLDALPTISESSVSSGKPDKTADPMPKERAAMLRRMGLNPKFAGVTSEEEILELRAAAKE